MINQNVIIDEKELMSCINEILQYTEETIIYLKEYKSILTMVTERGIQDKNIAFRLTGQITNVIEYEDCLKELSDLIITIVGNLMSQLSECEDGSMADGWCSSVPLDEKYFIMLK